MTLLPLELGRPIRFIFRLHDLLFEVPYFLVFFRFSSENIVQKFMTF